MTVISNYRTQKEAAKYRSTKPTLTDQSQAADSDVNVIMAKYAVTGTAPGAAGEPLYGDFSKLPKDLRGMIEMARGIEKLRGELPAQLAQLNVADLVEMDDKTLADLLKPAQTTPPKQEPPK